MNQLDEALSSLIGQWNGYSTGLITALVLIITYSIMTRVEAEIHPMLLARQAQGSPVRQEGESPIYRGSSAPHGMPLNSGLNVKEPGASKWSTGRDGDLRDIWKRSVLGTPEGEAPKGKGKILTVLGSQKVIEHKHDSITRAINLIGQQISSQGGSKVAIYLPNSVEFLATLFACSFYNLTAILLPFDEPEDVIVSMLQRSGADTVVTAPGAFPFDIVVKSYPALKQLIWVVDEGSKHLDWNEVPKGVGGSVNVSTWQDILNDVPVAAGTDLLSYDESKEPNDVVIFWKTKPGNLEEMVRLTQKNLVSAVSAQLTAVPSHSRFSPADLFLPAASLSDSFPLVLTLAALYSNASVALNSVAGTSSDIALATIGIAPTVVVATPETMRKTHVETTGKLTSAIASVAHWVQTRSLVQNGAMPVASFLTQFTDNLRPSIGVTPGKLRLLYVADSAGADTPTLSEHTLSDLRIFTGARVIYALTAAKVAGSVAQTQYHDYRVHGDGTGSHFGPPVSSVEVFLRDSGSHKTAEDGSTIEGQIIVRGPAVSGGLAELGVLGKIREDNTLAYV
ncbi:uncharacterized protein BCR38DRAFT_331130 [Pseudomassariella vexata]|uniref:AMP-dependent synthetase/ligase domain-containing protein n=1 Tax=Pseudomassariella vexata TaxID=1141098 RepID=A0A1Y2EJ92_9PEZI|nr:uncharacterized protein BCR38DRAFT_331130 [Pseudomassariella vexata]ORY71632.1 hypothetical protein BCR38DRAFT_331130 [Pseudomassariella vexata]